MIEGSSLVFVLIHIGKLALDVKEDLLPHGKLELDHAQLPLSIAK